MPVKILEVLSPLILDIALPCLIFTNIFFRFDPANFPTWWTLPLWWIGFAIVTVLFSLFGMWVAKTKYKSEFGMSLLYPNAIFVPMVVIQNLFGESSPVLMELFIFTLLFPAFMFNTYFLFFKSNESINNVFSWGKFLNPVLIATVLAVTIKLTGMQNYMPDVITSTTKILGNIALPLILILIGGNVYMDFKRKGEVQYKSIIKFITLKNFILPLIVLGILIIVKPPFSVAFLLFLLSAVPPITAVPILTDKAGGETYIANQFLIASFLMSIISIPLMMSLFQIFFPFEI